MESAPFLRILQGKVFFMDRKTIKIAAAVICGLALGALTILAAVVYSRISMDLVPAYVASHDIPPRTKITESDLTVIRIPSAYLAGGTYTQKEDILGKYTEIQGMIPAGSPFYVNMLYEEDSLPDYPAAQLKHGQAAYSLETDLASAGSLTAGMRADLYLTVDFRDSSHASQCLFEHVRIISLKDHQGIEIGDARSTGMPYLAVLAINQKDVEVMSVADEIGTIRMIASSASYDSTKEAVLVGKDLVDRYQEQLKKEGS